MFLNNRERAIEGSMVSPGLFENPLNFGPDLPILGRLGGLEVLQAPGLIKIGCISVFRLPFRSSASKSRLCLRYLDQ